MTLNAAFIQVFGEALEPLGFKKIKGRHPYFVRVVPGGEIIHVITFCKVKSYTIIVNCKPLYTYDIIGGVQTVYRSVMNLTKAPVEKIYVGPLGDFSTNSAIYAKQCLYDARDRDMEYIESIMNFRYSPDDENQMLESFSNALDITKQNLLPALDKAASIESCIDYFNIFHSPKLLVNNDPDTMFKDPLGYDESLLYFLIDDYHSIIRKRINKEIAQMQYQIQHGLNLMQQEEYEKYCLEVKRRLGGEISLLDSIVNNTSLHEKIMHELQRRKKANTETLRSYGLDL